MNIVFATPQHIDAIQVLAGRIWPHTFATLLSPQQIDYMMDMMYSTPSLLQQMNTQQYILVQRDNEYMGYLSYQLDNKENFCTKIHKIYVLPTTQGKGVGRFLIDEVTQIAKQGNQNKLELNVNRYNSKAVGFYQYMGFEIACVEDIDIGQGFWMEDYRMSKNL